MSRSTTFVGLNDRGKLIINTPNKTFTDQIIRTWSDGVVERFITSGSKTDVIAEICGFVTGMFDEEYPVHKYTMPDGKVYIEFMQAIPWFSGPVIFIALQDEVGNPVETSLWTEEEMSRYL